MFLNEKQKSLLQVMSVIHTGPYKKGDKTLSGKLWFIGENVCRLTKVELRTAKTGVHFILLTLHRSPATINGQKTKATFVPHTEIIFVDRLKEVCAAFDHELKDKPPEMDENVYVRHVKKRLDTFVGRELKVSVRVSKEVRRDEYGDKVKKNRYYYEKYVVVDYRMNIDMFYSINGEYHMDYRNQSVIFAKELE